MAKKLVFSKKGTAMNKAFTMLELVFVIVIIAIMSALMIPDMQSNKLREAAIQLVSHIRYTQHLAMIDDKYADNRASKPWYSKRWQIIFSNSTRNPGVTYSIFSDYSGTGNPDLIEIAKNPANTQKVLSGGHPNIHSDKELLSEKLNLSKSYGVDGYRLSGGCSGARISFDYLGRPMKGNPMTLNSPYQSGRLIVQRCIIKLSSSYEGDIKIAIEAETGFTCILNDNGDACVL